MKTYVIPVFIPHYGCPYQCSFCNQNSITGKKSAPRFGEIEETIREYLSYFSKKDATIELAYYGGSFTMIPRSAMLRYLEYGKELVEKYDLDGIRFSTRPDGISLEILEDLEPFPIRTIELGVQSMSDKVLKANNRGHDSLAVSRAVELLRPHYPVILQFMVGLYQETWDDVSYTASCLQELDPSGIRIYPTYILHHTELAKRYEAGEYAPLEREEALDRAYLLYKEAFRLHIPVIRVGLPPLDEEAIGPDHTGFRDELEERLIGQALDQFVVPETCEKITLHVPKREVSYYAGQNRRLRRKLEEKWDTKITLLPEDRTERTGLLETGGRKEQFDLYKLLFGEDL